VAHKQAFLAVAWSEHWKENYARLPADRQAACDRTAMELVKQRASAGHRIKPILPDKYYWEARISSGDRIIFRLEGGTIFFVDLVKHDDISRYARRPRSER